MSISLNVHYQRFYCCYGDTNELSNYNYQINLCVVIGFTEISSNKTFYRHEIVLLRKGKSKFSNAMRMISNPSLKLVSFEWGLFLVLVVNSCNSLSITDIFY